MAITGIDTIEGKQIIAAGAVSAKSAEMAYNDENGNPITGYQVAGDYYSASNPSGFITGVDLTPYQLTADMTAYQPAGAYLTTGDSANFYTTANESGFISEVPAGTMNESAFEYDENDNISGYNGSAFAGGSDVPEGVMVESGLEYDTNNRISGYSGSAFAGEATIYTDSATMTGQGTVSEPFGVKSTDLFVQEPLYTGVSGNSAYIGWRPDETVLWENPDGIMTKNIQWPQTLSEPITNFEKISFLYGADDYSANAEYHTFNTYNNFNYNLVAWRCDGPGSDNIFWREAKFNCNGTVLTNPYNSTINLTTAFNGGGFNTQGYNWLLKVVGVNRKV